MTAQNSPVTSRLPGRRGFSSRLLATVWLDIRLQWRNGFYAASLFVLAVLALIFSQVGALDLAWLLPAVVVSNLPINTFYFVGAMVLLEKGEGTLAAQVVSPLRAGEYLASKLLTLAGLSLVEALLVVVIVSGHSFRGLEFALGVVLAALLFTLAGFVLVVRYDTINAYLFPSVIYLLVLMLPLLETFGLMTSPWFYLHPLQAPLALLKVSFGRGEPWQVLYGGLYGGAWVMGLAWLARRSFAQFITRSTGVRGRGR